MNKEFLAKMIAAKKLEYEALRELLPEKVNANLDEINNCLKENLMEIVMELYSATGGSSSESKTPERNGSEGNKEQKVQKVIIE